MKRILMTAIRFYQAALSPFLGKHCRFEPSCSSYAHEALEKKGFLTGARMSFIRILKCHPLHSGGFDPVE